MDAQRRQAVRHQRQARQRGHCLRHHRSGTGQKGLSAFLVPTNTPGFEVARLEQKVGIKGSDTCAIHLTDCTIPEENMLGPRGMGLACTLSNLEGGRIGIARAAFEEALRYSNEYIQFDKPIRERQSIANMLADTHTKIYAARLLILHAAGL